MHLRLIVLLYASVAACSAALAADGPTMMVQADLRDAPRGLIRATLAIPVKPGPVTIVFPKWLPGHHGPAGPVADITNLKFSIAGQTVAWRRDLRDMYKLQLEIPAGASMLEASLESVASTSGGLNQDETTSEQLVLLNWNVIALFPLGMDASKISVEPSAILPAGWQFGCSMEQAHEKEGDGRIRFKPVSLEMLIDQPLLAGRYFRTLDLTPGSTPPHYMDIAADSEAALAVNETRLKSLQRMPAEFAAVFGTRPYERYHFLVALSDRMHSTGLEHHQCSANRGLERTLIDDEIFLDFAGLLTHEYFHAWNGKYRRPAGLMSPDYQQPMEGNLLWIYEGLTEYYGDMMAARAGMWSEDAYREYMALVAATLSAKRGRMWRPLQDTADMAQKLYGSGRNWGMRRRGTDFYGEGELIWLDVDTLIRDKTGGKKSLDDFCHAFFGKGLGRGGLGGAKPIVIPYDEEDIYAALNAVHPYDWKKFFATRLTSLDPEPPLGGFTRGGWKLVYTSQPNRLMTALEKSDKRLDLRFSLGLIIDFDDHRIHDVVPDSPADKAGIGPWMKIVAVDGRRYNVDLIQDAIKSTPMTKGVELLVENASYFSMRKLAYDGGPRYPHLQRSEGKPDLLAEILAPRAK